MRKKKVLIHGTAESLQIFFTDAVSSDFEILGVLSDENISVQGLEVLAPQNLPQFVCRLADGIIFTGDKSAAEIFLKQGMEPRKIILWDAAEGWGIFGGQEPDGTQVIFFCGLEFPFGTTSTTLTLTRSRINSSSSATTVPQ